ncbi:MAG: SLBB domain-containing protein [Nitrospirae bacterium]|nr:SLBB domain-containing protein [Nitrospirota bacterium]
MRVADLFSDINRPLGEAYLERADIIRLNEDRRTTTLIPVHLDKALEKDPVHNIQLAWMDRVIVYSKFDVAFFPPRVVTLAGAVQRPGNFERSESMTLKDLLVKGGGLMPDAYLDRADLLRYDFTKEITTIIPVDLGKVLAGETAANIPLLDKDIIRIYTMKETQFTPPHTVAVFGAVQRPGTYPRSEKMRLNDLLLAAGGPLPGYYEKMEVARARTEGEIRILSIDLPRLIQGDETQNISLEDEDIVMIKKKSEFFDKPIFITLDGEVKYPGTYPLRTRTDKISDLLKRAGGVTDRANPSGAVFTRKKEYIPSPEERSDLALVNQVINIVNNLEYERQLARNRFLMIQEQAGMIQTPIGSAAPPIVSTGSASEAAAIGMAPLTAQAAGQTVGGIIGSMETLPSVVSKPRQLGETTLEPSGRIIVNLPEALSDPGGKDDLVLKDGDTLKIPTRTMAVNVIGAVMRPTTVAYEKKRKLEQYINLAGGYTEDANQEKTLVLRLDGSILPVAEVDALEDGDVLYVPPKVMSLEIVERIDKIIDVVKFTLVTAASVGTFIFLVGLFVP